MPKANPKARRIDFNAQWSGKADDLDKIGKQSKGICGCAEYCRGSQQLVYGHVFRLHMAWRLSSRAFGASRSTSLGRLPSLPLVDVTSSIPHAATTLPEAATLPDPPANPLDPPGMSANTFDDLLDVGLDNLDDDAGDSSESEKEATSNDPEVLGEGEEDLDTELALLSHLEQEIADTVETGVNAPAVLTAQEEFRLAALLDELAEIPSDLDQDQGAHFDRSHLSYGHQLEGLVGPDDLILQWPFPIPTFLLNPPHAGDSPNPYLVATSDSSPAQSSSLLSRVAPLLALTLSGRFGVPRRAIELVLRIVNAAIRLAERRLYERMVAIVQKRFPDLDMATWEELQDADPVNKEEPAPRTSHAALKSIGVDYDLVVHPQCRNSLCHHVFYEASSKADIPMLPPLCPECSTPLRVRDNIEVLFFPRRLLWQELELVLAVPGVEAALDLRAGRKAQRDREDAAHIGDGTAYRYVLREQDDGRGWNPPSQRSSKAHVNDALTITVNMGLDWANPSSHRSASSQSMGPITLFLADLPVQVRTSMACSMIVGITPGPKEPKGENLHKLLLPIILELRSAQEHGIWVKTPGHPQGRLIRVVLGCIIADRPAAIGISGGGHYSAHDSPCIRCLVTRNEIPKADFHPSRLSFQHMRTCIDQYKQFRIALAADQEKFASQQDKREENGHTRKHYSEGRLKKLRDKVFTSRGHVSVLALIPGYDVFPNIPFDAMHAILEGLTKAYFFSVLIRGEHVADDNGDEAGTESDVLSERGAAEVRQQGLDLLDEVEAGNIRQRTPAEIENLRKLTKQAQGPKKQSASQKRLLGPGDLDRLQELMADVQIPMAVTKLHPQFGSASGGSPSADDWRTFASVYAPLVLPRLWLEHQRKVGQEKCRLVDEELWAMMGICEIVIMSLRSSLSDYQLDHLRDHINSWSKDVFGLHPSLKRKSNFHVVSHLVEDIERYGPPYNTWSFAVERVNFIAKNVPQARSSSARQVATLRAMMLARQVESLRSRHLGDKENFDDVDKDAAEDLDLAFRATSLDKAASALDLLGIRYEDEDRGILDAIDGVRAGKVPVRLRGSGERSVLQNSLVQSLQRSLKDIGILTRRNAVPLDADDALLPYLPSNVVRFDGMEWGRLRFDCAKPKKVTHDDSETNQLIRCRNSLFEAQSSTHRHGMLDERPMSGVLLMVFQHELVQAGLQGERMSSETRLYGVVREFEPYNGDDQYRLDRFTATGTQLWEADRLGEPKVVSLAASHLEGYRPLAITRLPKDIDDEGLGDVWATQPIDRH